MNQPIILLAIKFIVIFLTVGQLTAFSQGTLLIIPDRDCAISVDGETNEQVQKEVPKKLTLSKGEHYLQISTSNGLST